MRTATAYTYLWERRFLILSPSPISGALRKVLQGPCSPAAWGTLALEGKDGFKRLPLFFLRARFGGGGAFRRLFLQGFAGVFFTAVLVASKVPGIRWFLGELAVCVFCVCVFVCVLAGKKAGLCLQC